MKRAVGFNSSSFSIVGHRSNPGGEQFHPGTQCRLEYRAAFAAFVSGPKQSTVDGLSE
jgi:hypothetical protein